MIEIKVQVKDEDFKVTEQFLEHHEGICLCMSDPTLQRVVRETKEKIKKKLIDPETILKITYVWDEAYGADPDAS